MIEVLMWICVIVAVASGVAAITPTPKDDHWFRHVYMLVDWCALTFGRLKTNELVEKTCRYSYWH